MAGTGATATVDGGAIAGPAPRRSRRLLLIGAIAAVVLAAITAAGAHFLGLIAQPTGADEAAAATGDEAAPAERAHPPVLHDLPEFIVNLNAGGRRTRFLKLRSRLALRDPGDVAVVNEAMPRIIDVFQVYLRELRPEDLEGSAGTYRLREALVRRVGAEIGPERVSDLLFVELFVQ